MNFEKRALKHICSTNSTSLVSLATSVIALATSKGMTSDELAEATDISLIDFVNPHARISDYVISELTNEITKRWPDAPISMEIARSAPISTLGGLVQGSQFAPTVETVLLWWSKNQWIVADKTAAHVEQTASEVAWVLKHPGDRNNNGILMEAGIGIHWRLLDTITDMNIPLIRVEFEYEKPLPLQTYEAFFQAPVTFHTGRNALVFSKDSLGAPIRLANPRMFELIDHQFATFRQKQNRSRDSQELAKLRQGIAKNATRGEYGAAAAATEINLGLRSAQRLTAQHNTSLQQLINEVRLENAKAFLNNPELNIERVSQLLGYADARTFRRAFKRWTNLSPKEYRRSRL